jgi:hypothetical protein
MLPVLLALSFVKEGIKICCNIVLGNSLCFLETLFCGYVKVCRTYKSVCIEHTVERTKTRLKGQILFAQYMNLKNFMALL